MPDEDVSDATKEEDEREAKASHTADREGTDSENRAADEAARKLHDDERDESVREHYVDAMETGANLEGEGKIVIFYAR